MTPRALVRLAARLALTLAALLAALHTDAQTQDKVPHIGYLWIGAEGSDRMPRPGLQQGLRELGYHEGRDIIIEYRYADGSIERLHGLISDMVASRVDIIVAPGLVVADAVKRATTTVPVIALVGDARFPCRECRFGASNPRPTGGGCLACLVLAPATRLAAS